MSEKWTPGPWRIEEPDACVIWGECTDDRLGLPVANIRLGYERNWGREFEEGERIANAYLIAAAPELYGALKSAEFALAEMWKVDRQNISEKFGEDMGETPPLLAEIRIALAKARGETDTAEKGAE